MQDQVAGEVVAVDGLQGAFRPTGLEGLVGLGELAALAVAAQLLAAFLVDRLGDLPVGVELDRADAAERVGLALEGVVCVVGELGRVARRRRHVREDGGRAGAE
ncbi:MAG: hypothetical protein M3R46_05605, partial [Actinomycetota bacterium]|nr:hypothetical protein [Actinomycetota bacterium]